MQNFSFILIILSGLFGLIYGFKITNKFARIINWVMVIAIGISFASNPYVKVDGFYLFALMHLLIIVYAVSYENFSLQKKLLLAGISLCSVAPIIFFLGSISGLAAISFLPALAIGGYVYILMKDIQTYKEEVGFLTMLTANSITWLVGAVLNIVYS